MGFGTLFIGYFLLLNLTYYGFTDVIAAAVMLLGLYRLAPVNKYFSYSVIASAVFLLFSFGEFGMSVYEMFYRPISSTTLISSMSVIRSLIIAALTVLMLKGIEEIAREVELEDMPRKAYRLAISTAVTYSVWIILEAPLTFLGDFIPAVLSLITLIATIVLIIVNLSTIYTCYMRICMPGNEDIMKDKPSRFTFVNEYRARKAERAKDEAEARLQRLKERAEKKRGTKK